MIDIIYRNQYTLQYVVKRGWNFAYANWAGHNMIGDTGFYADMNECLMALKEFEEKYVHPPYTPETMGTERTKACEQMKKDMK